MVEPIMFLAIGFLLAALIGLGIVPLVHARAVRLTMKRLEASTPLSLAEIQADKDQLRAEFAMSARRLEMSVDQLKARTASQAAELGKKSDAVNRLKLELDDKNAAILANEEREKSLLEQLRTIDTDAGTKTEKLLSVERELAEKQAQITKLTHELTDRTMSADSRQVELVALTTQMEVLKSRAESAEKDVIGTRERLELQRSQNANVTDELNSTRSRAETLDARVKELEGELATKTREAEARSDRVDDLETQLSGQGKMLAERETEANLSAATGRTRTQDRTRIARGADGRDRNRRGPARAGAHAAGRSGKADRGFAQRDSDRRGASAGLVEHRTHRKCAAARAHQRDCRRGRPAGDRARRPRLPDRDDPGGAGPPQRQRQWSGHHSGRAGRAHQGPAGPRIARRPGLIGPFRPRHAGSA